MFRSQAFRGGRCLRTSALSRHGHLCQYGAVRRQNISAIQSRPLLTLAIETSCDDTSVAIVETQDEPSQLPDSQVSLVPQPTATLHFTENITADTRQYLGIHPIEALLSHQENLSKLVKKALNHLPLDQPTSADTQKHRKTIDILGNNGSTPSRRKLPDFISVTRGPGMRSNLSVGLETAKGLSVAWQIPMVGVNHMQAHLLTPRLVSALNSGSRTAVPRRPEEAASLEPTARDNKEEPDFPFMSILVSGGHSMIVTSQSLTNHKILATTADVAIGEALDKSARVILPQSLLQTAKNTMYGKLLEDFAFPNGPADYAQYQPPKHRGEEQVKPDKNEWGWSLTTPFADSRELRFSFSCVSSTVVRVVESKEAEGGAQAISLSERRELAREAMRVCFEHLASRTIIALESLEGGAQGKKRRKRQQKDDPLLEEVSSDKGQIQTLVVSGGVAANRFLMTVLRSFLDVRGFEDAKVIAPPPYLCTDNAAMIGWAGLEMFRAGWTTDLSCRALKKWTLDPDADDGGVLGPNGWIRNDGAYQQDPEYNPLEKRLAHEAQV